MKISDIIVLLYTLSHLFHYYSNPRVGHHALLGTCHVMTLLYALPAFNSRYNKAPLITLLLQIENKVYNCTNHAIKYFLSGVLRQKEHTLFTLYTIITLLLPLLTLYTLLHETWCSKVRVAKWQNKVCTWRGKTNAHTPRVSCRRRFPVYEFPRWVNDMDLEFMGSAQGVPMELRCRRRQSMPARDPNSPPQYAHLKPKEIGNFFLPPGIPPPALRRMP
jgi:hypothetical protein